MMLGLEKRMEKLGVAAKSFGASLLVLTNVTLLTSNALDHPESLRFHRNLRSRGAELSIAPAGASWLQQRLGFVCTTLLGISGSIVGR
jgi:hypothetical protein